MGVPTEWWAGLPLLRDAAPVLQLSVVSCRRAHPAGATCIHSTGSTRSFLDCLQVRDFLLRRMAAATGGQADGRDIEEQRKRQLEELLQQTEVTPQQLQELLSRAQLPAAQWKAVQRSMGLAEQRQGVCYDLPQQGGEALAAAATTSERAQLSTASLDGERFAATLHQLVWHNPKFAEGQVGQQGPAEGA